MGDETEKSLTVEMASERILKERLGFQQPGNKVRAISENENST